MADYMKLVFTSSTIMYGALWLSSEFVILFR